MSYASTWFASTPPGAAVRAAIPACTTRSAASTTSDATETASISAGMPRNLRRDLDDGRRPHHVERRGGRQGAGQVEALGPIAFEAAKAFEGELVLHAFGHDAQTEVVTEIDDRPDDGRVG